MTTEAKKIARRVDCGLPIWQGGAFEMRTLGAMTLRSLVRIAIAITALRLTRTDTVKSSQARTGASHHACG